VLTEMALRGIPDINKVFMKSGKITKFDMNDGFKIESEWMLDTEGVNLLAVMAHEDVDSTRTTSNHLCEVIEVLGIEAVRRTLMDELRVVLSFDGSYVNYRHLAILCDTMIYRGHLMSITRHGINRTDKRPTMRCRSRKLLIFSWTLLPMPSSILSGVFQRTSWSGAWHPLGRATVPCL